MSQLIEKLSIDFLKRELLLREQALEEQIKYPRESYINFIRLEKSIEELKQVIDRRTKNEQSILLYLIKIINERFYYESSKMNWWYRYPNNLGILFKTIIK